MAVTKDDIRQAWLELMDEFSSSLEQEEGARGSIILTLEAMQKENSDGTTDNSLQRLLSLPGVIYDMDPIEHPEAKAQSYAQLPYSVLATLIDDMTALKEDIEALKLVITEDVDTMESLIQQAESAVGQLNAALLEIADVEAQEAERLSAELARRSYENQRQQNETAREAWFNNAKSQWGDNNSGLKKDVLDAVESINTARLSANTQANRAKGYNDHPMTIGDDGHIYVWNENTQSMVKSKKILLSFDDLTPSQKEGLVDDLMHSLAFADESVCESIIDELT